MKVKICGITRLEDAETAVALGADMLGFNFFPGSKRFIPPQQAAGLIASLRAKWLDRSPAAVDGLPILVGVFVNSPLDEVTGIMALCGLDLAQFSGDEPPETVQALRGRGFKALRPFNSAAAHELVRQFALTTQPPAFLLDAYHPQEYGGTGQTGDWALAAQLARTYPLMLAGGLTPQNVATAVAQVQPWGVDVASGVESAPGVKDAEKMAQFIRNAKKHDT